MSGVQSVLGACTSTLLVCGPELRTLATGPMQTCFLFNTHRLGVQVSTHPALDIAHSYALLCRCTSLLLAVDLAGTQFICHTVKSAMFAEGSVVLQAPAGTSCSAFASARTQARPHLQLVIGRCRPLHTPRTGWSAHCSGRPCGLWCGMRLQDGR